MNDREEAPESGGEEQSYAGAYPRRGLVDPTVCQRCGGQLIQRNRSVLVLSGFAFAAAGFGVWWLFELGYLPAIFFWLTALYLIQWGDRGKGLWCRNCKAYPTRRP